MTQAKKKFSRKELKKPDEFIAKSSQIGEQLTVHKKKIIIGLAVVLGVLVVISGVYIYMEERALRSAQGMSEALDVLGQPVQTYQLFSGSGDEDEKTFGSVHEKDEATVEAFAAAQEKSESGAVRSLAVLGEAQALLGLGRYEEAEKKYRAFLDSPKGAEAFQYLAYEGLGMAIEGQGDLDGAMEQYEAIAKVSGGKYEELSLYHQARILELQDKDDEARELYVQLSDKIASAPKMTPMDGWVQDRIAGKDGVTPAPQAAGEPGMLVGPGGQMMPTPGTDMQDFSPEQLEELKKALEMLQKEEGGAGGGDSSAPAPPGPPPAPPEPPAE